MISSFSRILGKMVMALAMVTFTAQQSSAFNNPIGEWEVYPTFSATPKKVVATADNVYYLSGGFLFSYDKESQESRQYTWESQLFDNNITNIWYNHERNYLLVAYESGNIDIIFDKDDTVTHLPDISESHVDPPFTINDVAFAGDYVYIATPFGLVKFNVKRGEVTESGIYKTPVHAVTVAGDNVVIAANGALLTAKTSESIRNIARFAKLVDYNDMPSAMATVDDNTIAIFDAWAFWRSLTLTTYDFDTRTIRANATFEADNHPEYFMTGRDMVYYTVDDKLYGLPGGTERVLLTSLPEDLRGNKIGTYTGTGSLWGLSSAGLTEMSVSDANESSILTQRFRPTQFVTESIHLIIPNRTGDHIYFHNVGPQSNVRYGMENNGEKTILQASMFDVNSLSFKDVTPEVEAQSDVSANVQRQLGVKAPTAPNRIAESPFDKDVFYIATGNDGLYEIRNGELTARGDLDNIPMEAYWGTIINSVSFDHKGNMWLFVNGFDDAGFFILPAEKVAAGLGSVSKSDWVLAAPDGYTTGHNINVVHHSRSNVTFLVNHSEYLSLMAYDTNGTPTTADDKYMMWTRFTDQDGKVFSPQNVISIVEDRNGQLWVGTNEGVMVITNPAKATDPNMTVRRVKVPRNDGTNQADYLLGSDKVVDISVDASNRKWLATLGSGLFLASASGEEILEHFTTDNSPLPSNDIYSVYAHPSSATVFVGTSKGLLSYSSDGVEPASDLDEIFAFPNPVRPDYFGPVYIKGLMDNSLVKIANAAGHVVYQGRSEGGIFQWDACDAQGRRVRTGVYYVLASADGASSGAVTKIMVIN